MREQIEKTLDEYARPFLREHCGEVEVTRIEGDTVYVRLLGQCAGCASAFFTVDEVLEAALREHVPGVEHVVLDTYDRELYQYARELLHREKQN